MIEEPTTVPGSELADKRQRYGVTRRQLADELGLHRNTLATWEADPALDVLRQRRYVAGLRALVDGHDQAQSA